MKKAVIIIFMTAVMLITGCERQDIGKIVSEGPKFPDSMAAKFDESLFDASGSWFGE